ncbi:MAG: ribonuclease J [Bacillota bacterium]
MKEVRIIPLGGLGEIGKNLMLVESSEDIIAIDCGLSFPEEDMPGVDLVVPDISYLIERKDRLRAIILTHGHEDHVGALPYVLKDVNVPVYGTRLTLGLARRKLDELFEGVFDFRVVAPRDIVDFGSIRVQFFRVTHSVSDAVGLIIDTPVGTIVHTGDFKLDQTPVDGESTDYSLLAQAGERGVLALLSDSTHADRPGYTPSERVVGESLSQVFYRAQGRIIVTTFASNVPRIQQVIDAAYRYGRKVCVVGRSMETVAEVAINMGFLRVPMGVMIDVADIGKYPHSKLVILSTGSQGEPLSALARMSLGDHRKVEIVEGDLVIMAASPVPGNETTVSRVVDNLFRRGAHVVYTPESLVHVSGHASQEELKVMLNLTRPKVFIPVHGEYRHLIVHGELAVATGVPPSNVLIGENGTMFRLTPEGGQIMGSVHTRAVLIDGMGVSDVEDAILKERKWLGESGAIFVTCSVSGDTCELLSEPTVRTTGFMRNSRADAMCLEIVSRAKDLIGSLTPEALTRPQVVEDELAATIQRYLRSETGRRPVVICTLNIV